MTTIQSTARCIAILAGTLFSSVTFAQTPSYFPLQPGNIWVYGLALKGSAATQFRTISVDGQETINGRQYFDVTWFGRPVLLRDDSSAGTLTAYDRQSGTEQPWLSLRLPEGSTFPTTLDSCAEAGKILSRNAVVTTPAGPFDNVVQVGFTGHCADAGVTAEYFAPSVGMVVHEETSFAGLRRWELAYFHLASGNANELAFTESLDAQHYQPLTAMNVRLTLRSTLPDPLKLVFPSGQSYDLKILDSTGTTVYTWSANRAFPAIFRTESFGPGERVYTFTADLPNLPAGTYRARGYLTTEPLMFQAEVAFDVTPATQAATGSRYRPVSSKSRISRLRN